MQEWSLNLRAPSTMPGWSWEGQILTSAQHFCVYKWIHTTSALVPARNHFLKNNLIHNLDSGWDRREWVNLQSFPQHCGLFAPIPSFQHHQTIPLTLLLVVISPQDRVWDGGGQAQPARRICGNLRGRVQARVHGQIFSTLLLHGKFLKKSSWSSLFPVSIVLHHIEPLSFSLPFWLHQIVHSISFQHLVPSKNSRSN